jgi:tRNA1(Val) A37 N6-methylase TrmN6
LLAACDDRLGNLRILPLAPRVGRDAELVILRARKGARGRFRLLAPMILHAGDRHAEDAESYSEAVRGVLRNGEPFHADWR